MEADTDERLASTFSNRLACNFVWDDNKRSNMSKVSITLEAEELSDRDSADESRNVSHTAIAGNKHICHHSPH